MESIALFLLLIGLSSILVLTFSVYKGYQASNKQPQSESSESILINDTDTRCPRKPKKNRRKRKSNQNTKPSVTSKLLPSFTAEINRLSKTTQEANVNSDTPATLHTGSCANKIRNNTNSTNITKEVLNKVCVKKTDVTSSKSPVFVLPDQPENDGLTSTLYYIPRSDIRRIKGKGGRILKAFERKYDVKIHLPQNADGNVVISGGNEAIRRTVEAEIRDRMIMTISLPVVHPLVYAEIKAQVDLGKLKIVHQTGDSENRSVTFTGLAKHCKEILNVSMCH